MRALTKLVLAASAVGFGLLPATGVQAQLSDLLKSLPFQMPGNAAPQRQGGRSTSDALLGDAPPAGARAGVKAELQPDINCSRPRERFDVMEKLAEFGGTAATLRFKRLIETDFSYDKLTPQDHAMLRYIAQTTVWVPVEVESRLGGIFDSAGTLFGQGPKLTPLDEEALQQIGARLDALQARARDFPGKMHLAVDDKLSTGAFARFGGTIQVARSFLNGLTQTPAGADFVVAHELSHIYKRHAIKDIQYKLISTREGWALSRKILQRASGGAQMNPVAEGIFFVTTVPQLVEYVRHQQIRYGRSQELEADACAVIWLKGIGVNPVKAWNAYRSTLAATDTAADGYAATHPSTPERDARIRRKAGAQPAASDEARGPRGRSRSP